MRKKYPPPRSALPKLSITDKENLQKSSMFKKALKTLRYLYCLYYHYYPLLAKSNSRLLYSLKKKRVTKTATLFIPHKLFSFLYIKISSCTHIYSGIFSKTVNNYSSFIGTGMYELTVSYIDTHMIYFFACLRKEYQITHH